jgi:thioredoxin-like negative regulator of GroEL
MTSAVALALLLAAPAPPEEIRWERTLDRALEQARETDRPVLVFFQAEWCGLCRRMDRSTWVEPMVASRAPDFVMARIDAEGGERKEEALKTWAVRRLPTIVFLSPRGRLVGRVDGYQGPGQFPHTMDRALEGARQVDAWDEILEAEPEEPTALAALGEHLFHLERFEESHALLARATAHDRGRPPEERLRTRMLLSILQHAGQQYAEAEAMIKEALAIDPQAPDEPRLLFILGRTYIRWGRHEQGVETMQVIVQEHPQSPLAEKARETLTRLERK